ncbi:MAG: hypothetical protein CNLJKLNK_00645 [Holosporales bacterium]
MNNAYNITIALQGGGAHGAYAWGVMDRILDEKRLNIVGISGTSAGGMNAACTIQGLLEGSRKRSQEKLAAYWREISKMNADIRFESMVDECPHFFDDPEKIHTLHHNWFSSLSEMSQGKMSPYYFNLDNKNPFLDFLKDFFDFDLFKEKDSHQIFLGATHVKTGKIKVFSNKDMCADVLMASACLPFLFQTVFVDGEPYWDGGFIANPAIYPLMTLDADDIVIVQLTKSFCEEIPTTIKDITERLKEITYNGCLVREMRAIYFISNLIDQGVIQEGALRRFNMHLIKSQEIFEKIRLSSALNPRWDFVTALRDEGRKAADLWIEDFFSKSQEDRKKLDTTIFDHFVS